MKKKGIVLKTIGIIFLAMAVAVGAFAYKNRVYVAALIDGIRYDEKDLGEKNVKSAEKTVEKINEQISVELREITPEEKEKIASGELSQTAVMAQIIAEAVNIPLVPDAEDVVEANQQGTATEPSKETNQHNQASSSGSDTQNQPANQPQNQPATLSPQSAKSSDVLIAEAVSQLYGLQSQYTARLEGLVGSAKSHYLQKLQEVGNTEAKKSTLSTYSSQVVAMEGECDAKVEGVLSGLSTDLNNIGADTSIVSTLREAYKSEKATQRASYVNKYMK